MGMGSAGECAPIRPLLGVYLLGAIDPAGRAAVGRHLAGCPACRGELAGLAALPALLRRVPPGDLDLPGDAARPTRPGPPARPTTPARPGARGLLTRAVRGRRARRRQWLALAVAALLTAVAAGAAAAHVLQAAPGRAAGPALAGWLAVSAGNRRTGAGATVYYTARGWGTALAVRVSRVPPGTTCQLWVTEAGGQRAEAGGWTVTGRGPAGWYPASIPFAASSLRRFYITEGHRTLVSLQVRRSRPAGY
jgi:anti-sigma factor RsiW